MSVVKIRRLQQFNELVDVGERVVNLVTKDFEKIKEQILERDGLTESCQGCTSAGCCYQAVSVSIFEAMSIARRLHREDKNTKELREHLRVLGEEMESMSKDKWFNLAKPCAFLTSDNYCSIYKERPTACSTHVVVTPPGTCSPPSKENERIGVFDTDAVVEFMAMKLIEFQRVIGLPDEPVLLGSLPKMVAICLEAMTRPWDQFIDYIAKHGALTQEILSKMVTEQDIRDNRNKQKYNPLKSTKE